MNSRIGETVFDKLACCFSLKTVLVAISTLHVVFGLLMTIQTVFTATHYFHWRVRTSSEDELHLVFSFNTTATIQLIFGIYMFVGVIKDNATYILSGLTIDAMFFLEGLTFVTIPIISTIYQRKTFDHEGYLIEQCLFLAFEVVIVLIVYKYYQNLIKDATTASQESPAELINSSREADDVEVEYL